MVRVTLHDWTLALNNYLFEQGVYDARARDYLVDFWDREGSAASDTILGGIAKERIFIPDELVDSGKELQVESSYFGDNWDWFFEVQDELRSEKPG